MSIEELLSESVADATVRERNTFCKIAGKFTEAIVLFGAGNVGRKIARALKEYGITPLGFADNNPKLIGTKLEGVSVWSVAEAAKQFKDKAIFVVTVFHPTIDCGMQDRLDALNRIGCKTTVSFLPLAWLLSGVLPHYGIDLPSRILSRADEIKLIAESLFDQRSREVFREQLYWRLRGDFSQMSEPSGNQYFPPDLILPNESEAFVDGGAFDGDTLRTIPWQFERAWAIEPDPFNLQRLKDSVDSKVTIFPFALGNLTSKVRFRAEGTMASAEDSSGNVIVDVKRIDDVFVDSKPTFIKLDIEGQELQSLIGAKETIARCQPVLAVCIYHNATDFIEVPILLRGLLPTHRIALRCHAYDGFELVLYSIPSSRCSLKCKDS